MNAKLAAKFKHIFSKVAPNSPKIRTLSYLPKLETWRKSHKESYPLYEDRYKLYDYVNDRILNNREIIYLEFGVFKGVSIKYWSTINSCKESKFFGFDTFTGLPETWEKFTNTRLKGAFDVEGQIPEISDSRVSFIKGLFQHTLPKFLESKSLQSQLVIHNDADLYSSTLYVLTRCNDIISPGTIVIFDEFSSVLNEFRALEDYCSSYLRDYKILGATKSPRSYYTQVAIQMK